MSEDSLALIPPNSLDAERSVLGSMMMDPEIISEVVTITKPQDFYNPTNQKIYRIILDLWDGEKPIDIASIRDGHDELDSMMLLELMEEVSASSNAPGLARMIKGKRIARDLIHATKRIAGQAYQANGNLPEILEGAQEQIFDICSQDEERKACLLKDTELAAMDGKDYQGHETRLTGVTSGFKAIDELTCGFHEGESIVLAGRPSMGKTAALLNILVRQTLLHEIPIGLFSLEMSRDQINQRLLCIAGRIDHQRLRERRLTDEEASRFNEIKYQLERVPFYIDDSPRLSIVELRAKARKLVRRNAVKVIAVDYLQLLAGTHSESLNREVTEISRGLKAIARDLNITVISLSQLSRSAEQREDKHPKLSDLRDSGSIEQDADLVFLMYRSAYYEEQVSDVCEIFLAKQRNGPTGNIRLKFLKEYGRFEEWSF